MRFAALLLLSVSCFASAQEAPSTPPLTDTQIQTAIDRASNSKAHPIGLKLRDVDNTPTPGLPCTACGQTIYAVTLYTPLEWIEMQAAVAKRQGNNFTLADVTESFRMPVLRVLAVAIHNNGGSVVPPIAIQHVELADRSKKALIQPIANKQNQQKILLGGNADSFDASGATVAFDQVAVDQIASGGDFFVVLSTGDRTRYLRVKAQALAQAF